MTSRKCTIMGSYILYHPPSSYPHPSVFRSPQLFLEGQSVLPFFVCFCFLWHGRILYFSLFSFRLYSSFLLYSVLGFVDQCFLSHSAVRWIAPDIYYYPSMWPASIVFCLFTLLRGCCTTILQKIPLRCLESPEIAMRILALLFSIPINN